MSVSKRIILYVTAVALLSGCSYQKAVTLPPPGLPEQIYRDSEYDGYGKCMVAVFRFTEPLYAPGIGKKAAEAVYHELLRKNLFPYVANEIEVEYVGTSYLMELARTSEYDLIITGDVLYYFDGSDFEPSEVDQQIRVIHVPTSKTVLHVRASDVGPPSLVQDYIFVKNRGAPAPPASLLLQRNAEKFSGLIAQYTSTDRQ